MSRFLAILILIPSLLSAQTSPDSATAPYVWQRPASATVVGLTLALGAASHWVEPLDRYNLLTREEVFMFRHYRNSERYYTFDNYLQYLPVASAVALKICGVPSPHNTLQVTYRAVLAWGISSAVSYPLKHTTDVLRPDRSSRTSFPSGHSATSFLGAEILRLEYSNMPVIPVLGYAVATFTAFMRIYNDKHWLGDTLAGAAIGIISADLSYLICSKAESLLSPKAPPKSLSQCQISIL